MCYNVDDLLPVCEELNIPIIVSTFVFRLDLGRSLGRQFDYHHDWIYVRRTSFATGNYLLMSASLAIRATS